jgi:hypothetical protein
MISTNQAQAELKAVQQRLADLEAQLPRYQVKAADSAVKVSQARVTKDRSLLIKLTTEARVDSEILDQHLADLEAAKNDLATAVRAAELSQIYADLEGYAKAADKAKKQWHADVLVLNNILELAAERQALTASEAYKVITDSRVLFAETLKGLTPDDAKKLVYELREVHDITPLLLDWTGAGDTPFDELAKGQAVLTMPGKFKNLVWGLLSIVAKENGLPSLEQVLEFRYGSPKPQQSETPAPKRVVQPQPTPEPLPQPEPTPQPMFTEEETSSLRNLARVIQRLSGEPATPPSQTAPETVEEDSEVDNSEFFGGKK